MLVRRCAVGVSAHLELQTTIADTYVRSLHLQSAAARLPAAW
jgi:hypothetical protein